MQVGRATKGALAGTALLVGVATGGLYLESSQPTTTSASCHHVFAGRAGSLPCRGPSTPGDRQIQKFIGTTSTGCVIGFVGGGGVGAVWGCIGGAASNIPWG